MATSSSPSFLSLPRSFLDALSSSSAARLSLGPLRMACSRSEQKSKVSILSLNVTGRIILHLVPAWSALSGVCFQKNRIIWMQMYLVGEES
jgi:hypothetical protein